MIRLFLIFLWLAYSNMILGQCLEARINLVVSNGTVEEGLNQLSEQVPCTFSYNAEAIPLDSVLTVNLINFSLEQAIYHILGAEVEIRKVGSILILRTKSVSKTKRKKKEKYVITGQIIDRETGQVIESVAILQIDNVRSSLTNQQGNYNITVVASQKQVELAFRSHNFLDTIIIIAPYDGIELNLKMTPKDHVTMMEMKLPTIETSGVEDLGIVRMLVSEESKLHTEEFADYTTKVPVQISLLPTIGTNRLVGGIAENKVSFNVLAGYNHSSDGIEVAGLINIVKHDVNGAQLAGLGNIVGGELNGIQASGFFNYNLGKVNGIQLAGFSNTVIDSLDGSQFSGFANLVHGHVRGAQIAGFVNISTKRSRSSQFAGFMNIALDTLRGVQAAGFMNIAFDTLRGVQAAGFMNLSLGKMKGFQVAGFLNVAKKLRGIQIAPFNFADSVAGVTLGLFSIVLKGYHEFDLAYNSTSIYNLRFKSGTHHLYNILQAGGNFQSRQSTFYYFGYGLGTNQRIIKDRLFIDVDASASALKHNEAAPGQYHLWARLDAGLSFRIAGPLHIFIQATGNYLLANQDFAQLSEDIANKSQVFISGNNQINRWLGYQFGVRL